MTGEKPGGESVCSQSKLESGSSPEFHPSLALAKHQLSSADATNILKPCCISVPALLSFLDDAVLGMFSPALPSHIRIPWDRFQCLAERLIIHPLSPGIDACLEKKKKKITTPSHQRKAVRNKFATANKLDWVRALCAGTKSLRPWNMFGLQRKFHSVSGMHWIIWVCRPGLGTGGGSDLTGHLVPSFPTTCSALELVQQDLGCFSETEDTKFSTVPRGRQ